MSHVAHISHTYVSHTHAGTSSTRCASTCAVGGTRRHLFLSSSRHHPCHRFDLFQTSFLVFSVTLLTIGVFTVSFSFHFFFSTSSPSSPRHRGFFVTLLSIGIFSFFFLFLFPPLFLLVLAIGDCVWTRLLFALHLTLLLTILKDRNKKKMIDCKRNRFFCPWVLWVWHAFLWTSLCLALRLTLPLVILGFCSWVYRVSMFLCVAVGCRVV